jgi:hypothetical protein
MSLDAGDMRTGLAMSTVFYSEIAKGAPVDDLAALAALFPTPPAKTPDGLA